MMKISSLKKRFFSTLKAVYELLLYKEKGDKKMKTAELKTLIHEYNVVFFMLFVAFGWLACWLGVILFSLIVL